MMPSPNLSLYFLLLIVTSAVPSIIWINVSKGTVFSLSSSPASREETVIFPVVFLIIVLIKTELGTYSKISTMICGVDFSNSVWSINQGGLIIAVINLLHL